MEPAKVAPEGEIKEVQMDYLAEEGGGRRRGRRRRTRKGAVSASGEESGPVVEKEAPASASATATATAPTYGSKGSGSGSVVKQKSAAVTPSAPVIPPKVVIAPPKKKPARVLLVAAAAKPTTLIAGKPVTGILKKELQRKTFRVKHVRLVIDNTAKTQKRRRQTLQKIDALTDEQVRQACLDAKLSRKETVAKVPIGLLRQMLKDYQTMRGNLL